MIRLVSTATACSIVPFVADAIRSSLDIEDHALDIEGNRDFQSCAALKNEEAYFSVQVSVGTPPQVLNLVADTGSNSLVVESCVCQENGGCPAGDQCFTGTDKSSTFSLFKNGTGQNAQMMQVEITYGSGPVQGVIAEDRVNIGGVSSTMTDGFMLMVSRQVNFNTALEGILGLGVPDWGGLPAFSAASNAANGAGAKSESEAPCMTGFLEQAGLPSFSICFAEEGGALRFNPQSTATAIDSVGHLHWGVSFEGVSIGSSAGASDKLAFCQRENMAQGMQTPCGAIVDSGTTLITGPSEQVSVLLESLCDDWQLCKDNYTALVEAASAASETAAEIYGSGFDPFGLENASTSSKTLVLMRLLSDCQRWMGNDGLNSLPAVKFHVASGDGLGKQALQLDPEHYIFQVRDPATDTVHCSPAFDVGYEEPTTINGQVWIFGTPFFYAHHVSYNLAADPPTVTFAPVSEQKPCTPCAEGSTPALHEESAAQKEQPQHEESVMQQDVHTKVHMPRAFHGVPRRPKRSRVHM